jgi:hypothetical protein
LLDFGYCLVQEGPTANLASEIGFADLAESKNGQKSRFLV